MGQPAFRAPHCGRFGKFSYIYIQTYSHLDVERNIEWEVRWQQDVDDNSVHLALVQNSGNVLHRCVNRCVGIQNLRRGVPHVSDLWIVSFRNLGHLHACPSCLRRFSDASSQQRADLAKRCTLHTLHFTLHIPHSPPSTPHFIHTLHSPLHTLHFTLHTPHFTLYTPHFTLYTPHSPLFTLHTLHSTL